LKVVCLERRRLDDAGARWLNDVPAWMFDEARIDRLATRSCSTARCPR
jgi:hypothetical protein